MDAFVFKKIKIINETIYDLYYHEVFKKYQGMEASLKDSLQAEDKLLRLTPVSEEGHVHHKRVSMPQKRELSLKLQGLSKTIDNSPEKGFPIRSFKSTI